MNQHDARAGEKMAILEAFVPADPRPSELNAIAITSDGAAFKWYDNENYVDIARLHVGMQTQSRSSSKAWLPVHATIARGTDDQHQKRLPNRGHMRIERQKARQPQLETPNQFRISCQIPHWQTIYHPIM